MVMVEMVMKPVMQSHQVVILLKNELFGTFSYTTNCTHILGHDSSFIEPANFLFHFQGRPYQEEDKYFFCGLHPHPLKSLKSTAGT
jgi:hypothetical protein